MKPGLAILGIPQLDAPWLSWEPPPVFPGALCTVECVGDDVWFPQTGNAVANGKQERLAVSICQECPYQVRCADYAVSNHIEFGVWGGLTEADRQTIWQQDEQEQVA